MIELAESQWLTGTEAAHMAGISESALRKRRHREQDEHPPFVSVNGNTILYPAEAFAQYVARWIDGRTQVQR